MRWEPEVKMAREFSKRMKQAYEVIKKHNITNDTQLSWGEALKVLRECPETKFPGSVDLVIRLGIDPRKSDQNVRGAADMPNGLGREVKVAVFGKGTHQKDAQDAKADYIIGDEESAKDFIKGSLDVQYCVATPDLMADLVKWGVSKVLGPKGLMPNAKIGTVTFDVKTAVTNLKKGQAMFKNDSAGYLHASVGLTNFTDEKLIENAQSLLSAVQQAKPAPVKEESYIRGVSLTFTMRPSIKIKLD